MYEIWPSVYYMIGYNTPNLDLWFLAHFPPLSNEWVSWEIDIFLKRSLYFSFLKLQSLSELKEMTVKRKIFVNCFANQWSILHDVPRFHNWHEWSEFFYFFYFSGPISFSLKWKRWMTSKTYFRSHTWYHRDYYIPHPLHIMWLQQYRPKSCTLMVSHIPKQSISCSI